MADTNFMEELEINGVAYTVKDPNSVKRIKLSSQIQRQDYVKSVIALCATDGDDSWLSSYSAGQLIMHRSNGLYGMLVYNIAIEAAWYGDNQINANISGFGKNGYVRPCTFMYNGTVYGGVEIAADAASMETSYFVGESNFDIFGLDYYDDKNKVALNEEIANTIKFDTVANARDTIIKNVADPVDDGDAVSKSWAVTNFAPVDCLTQRVYTAIGEIANSSGTAIGYGAAIVHVTPDGIVRIDFSVKVTVAGSVSTVYDFGLSIPSIRAINTNIPEFTGLGQSICTYYKSDGTIDTSKAQYCGICNYSESLNRFCLGRIYTTTGSYGAWPDSQFATDSVITGTCFGVVS